MGTLVLSGATSGSTTIAPTDAATVTATFPGATGTVMVSGNMPAFSAYSSVAQSISSSTYTKVTFDTKEFDTNNNFTSSRFTPTVAGYYQFTAGIQVAATTTTQLVFYKNGAVFKYGNQCPSISYVTNNSTALIYCNGSTDYVELYALFGATNNTNPSNSSVYFQASMVRAA